MGVVDRQGRLWWFDLSSNSYPRFNLATYDRLHRERLDVLVAHDEWSRRGGAFPTAPYWHRDCPDCPFREHCEEQLEKLDDVSLVRFTSFSQQLLMREHGVETRAQLARLDPARARRARSKVLNPLEPHEPEEVLGRTIDKLDDLIYRARAFERGTSLRVVDSDEVGCPTADVEVDVDMESYDDATYLWGAYVSSVQPTDGVRAGYHAFVEWGELTRESEAKNFREFWAVARGGSPTLRRAGSKLRRLLLLGPGRRWRHEPSGRPATARRSDGSRPLRVSSSRRRPSGSTCTNR